MPNISVSSNVVERTDIREPSRHNVIFYNDDVTTVDFVVSVLRGLFNKGAQDAYEVAQHIHLTGAAIVGTYTKEIAEEKVAETTTLARKYGYPLVVKNEEA